MQEAVKVTEIYKSDGKTACVVPLLAEQFIPCSSTFTLNLRLTNTEHVKNVFSAARPLAKETSFNSKESMQLILQYLRRK